MYIFYDVYAEIRSFNFLTFFSVQQLEIGGQFLSLKTKNFMYAYLIHPTHGASKSKSSDGFSGPC